MTLWDGGGRDTYDFSNYATDMSVNLQPGGWSTISARSLQPRLSALCARATSPTLLYATIQPPD
jgi:hypothetical protein